MFAGLFAAAAALEQSVAWLGLSGPADLAGLPVLLLAVGAVSLVGRPALQAISRAHERNADRFALELTRNPDAFVSAMRRLAAQNLAEERPSKIIEWLFYSHPPMRERILAAQASKVKSRVGPPDASVARTAPIR
jgi:Zn-dependent protease with chaperone function